MGVLALGNVLKQLWYVLTLMSEIYWAKSVELTTPLSLFSHEYFREMCHKKACCCQWIIPDAVGYYYE